MLKSIILTCFFLYLVKAFPLQLCKLHINGVKSTSGNQACNQQRWCRRSGSKISLQKSSEDRESTSFINYCSPVATWGEGLSQADLMNKDECIVVDDRDQIIGHDSKYSVHRFDPKNPKGILHRAFSVFLFNQEGKLLLQKRASDKITFPSVWTNTCCSHPLYGYTPSEVDDEDSVNKGELFGEYVHMPHLSVCIANIMELMFYLYTTLDVLGYQQ